jgi:peptide/nickel transport system substrate-binding protein
MKKLLALLLVFVMAISLFACKPDTNNDNTGTSDTKYGGHVDYVFSFQPTNIDPAKSTGLWGYVYTSMIYEAPLTRDAEGNIRPNVCDFELSDDQLTLKLWVRDGVTFHDGSAVEIEDVIASIKRSVHKSPRQFVAPYIKDVQIDENGVATITFTEYNEKTMYYIACVNPFIGVMPKEIAEEYSYESGNVIIDVEDAIGTGPYKVTELVSAVSVTLERYKGYKAVPEGYTGFAAPKMAYIDSFTFYYDADTTASNTGMLSGDYDIRAGAGTEVETSFTNAGLVKLNKLSNTGVMINFNTYEDTILGKSADMRKAMIAAVDWVEYFGVEGVEVDGKGVSPVLDSLYATDVFANAPYFVTDGTNVATSKRYQEAAGYKGEEIKIVINSGLVREITSLSGYWKAAGINIKIVTMEATAYGEMYLDKSSVWGLRYQWPSLNNSPTLLSTTIMSDTYSTAAKNELYAELTTMIAGSAEYKAKWNELAQQMVNDCAVVFMNQATLTWWSNPDLVFDYDGLSPYLFNAYWKNPTEHGPKD